MAIYAAGYIVASIFPCDPGCRPSNPSTSQLIHNAGGLAGYLLAPVFLIALTFAARNWVGAAKLVMAGYVASIVAFVGLVTFSLTSNWVGLSQRALEISVLGWVTLLGIYLAGQHDAH